MRSGETGREKRSGKTARVARSGEIAPEVVIDSKGMNENTAFEVTTGGNDLPRTQIVERRNGSQVKEPRHEAMGDT